MTSRLLVIAHAVTSGTRELRFGDRTGLLRSPTKPDWPQRMASLTSGPEPACVETAQQSGREPDIVAALAGFDSGRWTGLTLDEVVAADPDGVRAWLSDPAATPHDGESLAGLIGRVGPCCDEREWPVGRSVVVVAPLVARAMVVHALSAPAEVIFRVDVAPLGRVGLSRHGAGWRLQQLG